MSLFPNPNQPVLLYQGQYYPLNKPQIIIGSDPSCDIRIDNNPQVFPMHAQVISQAGQVFLQYMKRGAAIWVNGSPTSQQELKDQDEIAVGNLDTRLTLRLNRNLSGVKQLGTWTNATQAAQNTGVTRVPGAQSTGGMNALNNAQRQSSLAAPSQSQAPTPAMNTMGPDTTRYLCAAGHLDEGFQDYVLRNVIYEERRTLGESYGVNMSTVVSWCKSGINRINIRDGILSAILALAIVGYFLVINLIVGLINTAASSSSSYTSSYGSSYGSSHSTSNFSPISLITTIVGSLITIVIALIILIIGYNIEKWVKRRWPKSHPGVITYLVLLIPFNIFGFIIIPLIWLTILIELLVRYYGEPVKRLRKNTFNPQIRPVPLDDSLANKLQENFVTGQRNVIAYSGYRPFAGAGFYKSGWSFVIDTSKGAYDTIKLISSPERQSPLPFTVSSLYDEIERDVWALGVNNVLEIEGKLYVRGQYLPEYPPFFNAAAQRPMTSVDPRLVEQYKENPTEDIRYYQCLRFNFWRGEMIFTAFLRFVQRGKDLFTEIDYVLLPPMKPDYYWVDQREITPLISEIWRLYLRSLDKPIQMWLDAPFRLFRGSFYAAQQRKLARIASNNPAFDYGASTSLRQFASDDEYHLFFQELDEQMYLKVIEKQILETIANFLDAHQIDTTDLRQRQQTILNNNTTHNNTTFNGDVNNSGSMGIGTGAQVHANSTQP